jgi:hypothetical protein
VHHAAVDIFTNLVHETERVQQLPASPGLLQVKCVSLMSNVTAEHLPSGTAGAAHSIK